MVACGIILLNFLHNQHVITSLFEERIYFIVNLESQMAFSFKYFKVLLLSVCSGGYNVWSL